MREFVDMVKLLQDSWRLEDLAIDTGNTCSQKLAWHKSVTDIVVWTKRFCTMAAIITVSYPDKALELFAYLRTITEASRTFEGPAWVC